MYAADQTEAYQIGDLCGSSDPSGPRLAVPDEDPYRDWRGPWDTWCRKTPRNRSESELTSSPMFITFSRCRAPDLTDVFGVAVWRSQ
jgi:hypothetical protein